MPQYRLREHYIRAGITLVQGSIVSTDVPQHGLFYISPQDAERLLAEGILSEELPEVLTGARSKEPGWRRGERRECEGDPGPDFHARWG